MEESEEEILKNLDFDGGKIKANTKLLTKDKTFIRFAVS